jgi:hypothetical protein
MSLHESARVEIQALFNQVISIYLDLARLTVIDKEQRVHALARKSRNPHLDGEGWG